MEPGVTPEVFDFAPVLTGETLQLRPLVAADREALYAAAADPLIWAGHPARTRHQRAEFDAYFDFLRAAGGTLVVTLRADGRLIGASRFYQVAERPGSLAIGFTFLARAYWGGATNREMKALMLAHGFRWYDAVWFDVGCDNLRSQRAMEKLGAENMGPARLSLGRGAAEYLCYRMRRQDWQAGRTGQG